MFLELYIPRFALFKEQRHPALTISVVMWSILTNVSFTLGYILPDAVPIYYLPKRLLINYLIAFGLATGVNFVVLPVTSRKIFFVLPNSSITDIAFL